MIINFLGDSITEGHGTSAPDKRFPDIVGKRLGVTVRNYGIGGSRIARQKNPNPAERADEDFNMRAMRMERDADLVIVFGGTNDFGHSDASLGKAGDTDVHTFYGAVTTLIEYLIDKYGKDKLCFILPLHRSNEDNPRGDGFKPQPVAVLATYVAIMKELLTKYGIDTLSFENEIPFERLGELTTDGLHPNDAGHRILADGICRYIEGRAK